MFVQFLVFHLPKIKLRAYTCKPVRSNSFGANSLPFFSRQIQFQTRFLTLSAKFVRLLLEIAFLITKVFLYTRFAIPNRVVA
jgi:hypothetical protein